MIPTYNNSFEGREPEDFIIPMIFMESLERYKRFLKNKTNVTGEEGDYQKLLDMRIGMYTVLALIGEIPETDQWYG